MTYLLFN